MANGGLQSVGFFVGYIALSLIIVAVVLPFWKMNDLSNEQMAVQRTYAGLWLECTYIMSNGGVYTCNMYQKFFIALPMYLQGSRGMAITSLFFGSLGVLTGIIGMECTRLAEETEGTKKTMGITSGVCSILSGICFIVSCSWFASQIYQDFGQPSNALNPQFVYGACLYLGWGASVMMVAAGALMVFGSCGDDDGDDDRHSVNFQMTSGRLLGKSQNGYV